MKLASVMAAVALCATQAAAATLSKETCGRAGDIRVIEVVSPGDVGAACDVRYVREGGKSISVPYNADNAADYCGKRASELVASLTAGGFSCVAENIVAQVPPAPASTSSGPVLSAAQPAAATPEPDLDALLAGGPATNPSGASASDAATPATAENVTAENASVSAASLAHAERAPVTAPVTREVLTVPPPPPAPIITAQADAAPVALATAATPIAATHARYDVGRVVGPSPDDQRPATLGSPAPSAANQAPPASDASRLAPPTPPAAAPSTGRPPLDAAKATVLAQAAAWNDGDLAGFMNGFWNNPEFVLIAGPRETKGWQETYALYRQAYGESGDLGRLIYHDLDAKLLDADTAAVSGRYDYLRGAATSSGVMSLVLRRFEGAWRVVRQQTSADGTPATKTGAPVLR